VSHEFEQIEDGVIALLAPLKTAGTIKTLEIYAGQLGIEDINRITKRFPCCYVVCSNLRNESINNYDYLVVSINIIAGDKNVRGNKKSARGDSYSVGVYGILDAVREKLHRENPVSGWSEAMLQNEDYIVYAPETGICLYSAEYEIKAIAQ
jgi:hypothetical protein